MSMKPETAENDHKPGQDQSHSPKKMYLRFAAMILTAMVVMYWVMFVGSWEWGHIRFSQSRVFMAVTMGGTMGLVMLAWMLNMYKNVKANVAVIVGSLLLIGGGVVLDRSQITVGDTAFMRAMIPHHSLAITRSERAQIEDLRVCELAVEISEAQRREILEMNWLIGDIERNGVADTSDEADSRPVPNFEEAAERLCSADR
jgi:cytochrome c oxidase subunit IV